MDHFINIPIDSTGLLPDQRLAGIVSEAMRMPFEFTDVFVYSHGWWTSAIDAMADYSRFSIEFLKTTCSMSPSLIAAAPKSSFGVGIHWPSLLSENNHEIINLFEPLTFYQMEKRSDVIGQNGLYALLKLMYEIRNASPIRRQFRLTLIGHSFGCRVICKAMQTLFSELMRVSTDSAFRNFVATTTMKAILLQPAMENIDLQRPEAYGDLVRLPLLSMLVTRSDLDYALKNIYPLAEHINFLSKAPGSRVAMGFSGPSAPTMRDWNAQVLHLLPGYNPTATMLLPPPSRMLVCDLTQVHRASEVVASALTGHHSDIFHPEIYKLIAKFAFD
jgi:hypothetical protein